MEADFCVAALRAVRAEAALEIFYTDQGSRFLCRDSINEPQACGQAFDKIFMAYLCRRVKHEETYFKDCHDGFEARRSLRSYFNFSNGERPQRSRETCVPEEVYRKASLEGSTPELCGNKSIGRDEHFRALQIKQGHRHLNRRPPGR